MLKIYRRFKMAARTGEFFALHQWDFISRNIQELNKDTSAVDRRTFPVDITQVVWDTYVKDYVFGIRNYVLKDPPSTIPQALSKLQRYTELISLPSLFISLLINLLSTSTTENISRVQKQRTSWLEISITYILLNSAGSSILGGRGK